MPRKPKLPIPMLVIEGLSGAQRMRAPIYDDFDGHEIKHADSALPRHEPRLGSQEMRSAHIREQVLGKAMMLEWLSRTANVSALSTGVELPKPPPAQPKLAHNQIATSSGLVITVRGKRNPLRRL